jgi:hypothetical protein
MTRSRRGSVAISDKAPQPRRRAGGAEPAMHLKLSTSTEKTSLNAFKFVEEVSN